MAGRRRYSRKKKSSGVAGVVLGFLLAVLCMAGFCLWLAFRPYGPQTETFVELPAGASSYTISAQLEASGIIRSRYAFDLVRFIKRGTLHAGGL